jgi:hypothetical protein
MPSILKSNWSEREWFKLWPKKLEPMTWRKWLTSCKYSGNMICTISIRDSRQIDFVPLCWLVPQRFVAQNLWLQNNRDENRCNILIQRFTISLTNNLCKKYCALKYFDATQLNNKASVTAELVIVAEYCCSMLFMFKTKFGSICLHFWIYLLRYVFHIVFNWWTMENMLTYIHCWYIRTIFQHGWIGKFSLLKQDIWLVSNGWGGQSHHEIYLSTVLRWAWTS